MELQGEFLPKEDISNLIQFVKENLADPSIPFYLCIFYLSCSLYTSFIFIDISPPVVKLEKGTFESLGLLPTAVVLFAREDKCTFSDTIPELHPY